VEATDVVPAEAGTSGCQRDTPEVPAFAGTTEYPVTPDGRYFVVRGRLWRLSNPALDPGIKRALGERGPVWWTDGAPDWNRRLAKNTPYADWWAAQMPPGTTR
jgi:hypothetical protein